MRHMILACAFAAAFAANHALADSDCPLGPDLSERRGALMETLRLAPDENSARLIANDLWEIWSTAPNKLAQELLDEGMDRRAAFDLDAAIKAFDALIAYCPDYAEGYNQRAFALFIRQDYDAALADLDSAIARRPDHVAALAGRALTLMGMGQDAEAQAQLRAALKLNPWLPERRFLTPNAPGAEQEL